MMYLHQTGQTIQKGYVLRLLQLHMLSSQLCKLEFIKPCFSLHVFYVLEEEGCHKCIKHEQQLTDPANLFLLLLMFVFVIAKA